MRVAVIGGGPGGLYLAALTKQLDPTTRSASGSATPRRTPSASASCSPTRRWAASRRRTPCCSRDRPQLRPLVRHRRHAPRAHRHLRRPRIRRHRPPACCCSCCSSRCADVGRRRPIPDEAPDRSRSCRVELRPGRRRRRRELGRSGARYAEAFAPTWTSARPLHVAGHRQGLQCLHLHRRRAPRTARCRCTPTRSAADRSTFIVEIDEATWRRAGFDAVDATTPAARRQRQRQHRPHRGAVRRAPRRRAS